MAVNMSIFLAFIAHANEGWLNSFNSLSELSIQVLLLCTYWFEVSKYQKKFSDLINFNKLFLLDKNSWKHTIVQQTASAPPVTSSHGNNTRVAGLKPRNYPRPKGGKVI